MALSRTVSAERCGQKPDCSGLPGEVTFEPGCEWQVRSQPASCGPLTDGEEETEDSGCRRQGDQGRAPAPMGAHSWAAMQRQW